MRRRRRTVLISGVGCRLVQFCSTRKSFTKVIFKILAPHEAVHAGRGSPHFAVKLIIRDKHHAKGRVIKILKIDVVCGTRSYEPSRESAGECQKKSED